MGSDSSAEGIKLSPATIAVHRGERAYEQPFGSVGSPVFHSSHVGFSNEQLKAAGVSAATVRFTVGIEAADDIIADITQSLDKI